MNLAARKRLRLKLRDLAALSAFIAVALSGTLPLWVNVAFAGAWVSSMFGVRPLARRPVLTVLVLLGTAVVLFGLAFRGAMDLVVSAASFALLVTAQRMTSEPGPTTDQQVLLASLLLMAGAAALSGEMWYALSLLSFGTFACLALGLAVIEGPEERDGELPVKPVLTQVMVGVALALVGGLAFFVLFPRLSWNMAARRTPPGVLGGTTGMSDRVRLGGSGNLKTSARIVLRAKLEPDPKTDELEQYWVGRVFDHFDGKEWKGSGADQPARTRVQVSTTARKFVVQRIELLPAYEARTLVGLDTPFVFDGAMALSTNGQAAVGLIEAKDEEVRFAGNGNGYQYSVASRDPEARAAESGEVDPKYLALPTLDPRIAELAKRIVGDEKRPLEAARKLERYLRSSYSYSLTLAGDVDDPLADFLLTRREGHCEHFATGLAVLLRAVGIPARVTAGFFGGQRVNDAYVLRAGDAHAWVQAYIRGTGWVRFDATPESGRRNNTSYLLNTVTTWYERLEQLWQSRVVDYSFQDQLKMVNGLVRPPPSTEAESPSLTRLPRRAIAVAFGVALSVFLVLRALWRPARRKPHPAATFLDEIEVRLERAHIARHEGEGLEELSTRLTQAGHPLAPAVQRAAKRYLEARFGQKALAKDERAALLAALIARPGPRQTL